MTRFKLALKRYSCPSCKVENLVQPVRSINTLVVGLDLPSAEQIGGVVNCIGCGQRFNTESAFFLGWINENTPADPAVIEKYSIPAFLKK